MFYKSNPNFNSCIPVYLHTCISPNKPNSTFLYTCIPVYLHTCILPNKPNFPIFDLKTRASAKKQTQFFPFPLTFALCRLPFYFFAKRTQF